MAAAEVASTSSATCCTPTSAAEPTPDAGISSPGRSERSDQVSPGMARSAGR